MSGAGLVLEALQSPLAGPFDLDVAPGALIAISGASGSGKSLFLRMIADLDPNTGRVWLDGISRADLPAHQWRRRAPYVAAESGWWAPTVAEHFASGRLSPARALAERLGVAGAAFEGPVERLSTGERQRLALIRALVLDPPALLLDEPTGPLDPVSVQRVEGLLLERTAAGALVVMVSHDPAQGVRLGARRMRMADFRLEAEG